MRINSAIVISDLRHLGSNTINLKNIHEPLYITGAQANSFWLHIIKMSAILLLIFLPTFGVGPLD